MQLVDLFEHLRVDMRVPRLVQAVRARHLQQLVVTFLKLLGLSSSFLLLLLESFDFHLQALDLL